MMPMGMPLETQRLMKFGQTSSSTSPTTSGVEVGTVDKQTMRDFDDTCHLPEHCETDQTDPA